MNGGRIVVRLTIFLAATLATGVALWFGLLGLALYVFDEYSPECTDSDTCGAWGDFAYHLWPGGFVCFAVGAVIWWVPSPATARPSKFVGARRSRRLLSRDTARAMSQQNVEIVRRLWNAAERGNDKEVYALYDPAIVWNSGKVGPLELGGGPYHGHDGVRQFFRDWLESFGTYQAKAETFIEAGNQVVVGYRVSGRGKGSGIDVEMPRWNVYGIQNGLVNRVDIFDTKAEALEAVGLSEQDAHADS